MHSENSGYESTPEEVRRQAVASRQLLITDVESTWPPSSGNTPSRLGLQRATQHICCAWQQPECPVECLSMAGGLRGELMCSDLITSASLLDYIAC